MSNSRSFGKNNEVNVAMTPNHYILQFTNFIDYVFTVDRHTNYNYFDITINAPFMNNAYGLCYNDDCKKLVT